MLTLMVLISLGVSGCQSAGPGGDSALSHLAQSSAPRAAVALVVQNNPALVPVFEQVAERLRTADGALTPEEIYADAGSLLASSNLTPLQRGIALLVLEDAVEWYRLFGGETGLDVATPQQTAALRRLGLAIESGVRTGMIMAELRD